MKMSVNGSDENGSRLMVSGKELFVFDDNSILSNCALCVIFDPIENGDFLSVEQLYQARKAKYFSDFDSLDRLCETTDLKTVKCLGRAIRNYDRYAWEAICNEEMFKALLLKVCIHRLGGVFNVLTFYYVRYSVHPANGTNYRSNGYRWFGISLRYGW